MYNTKIQTPIQTKVLEKARKRADDIGFGSINEVIRIMLKQFGDGKIDFSLLNIGNPQIEYLDEAEEKEIESLLKTMSAQDRQIVKSKIIEL